MSMNPFPVNRGKYAGADRRIINAIIGEPSIGSCLVAINGGDNGYHDGSLPKSMISQENSMV